MAMRIPFVVLLLSLAVAGKTQTAHLYLANRLSIARTDEPIVLTRSFLEKKLGKLPNRKYVQVFSNNQPVLVQYDDLEGTGRWTEIFLLMDFHKGERKKLRLQVADRPAAIKAVVRSYARHKRLQPDNSFGEDLQRDSIPANQPATDFGKQKLPPFLTEGPAWENDKVGFRLYSDVRNGKDIWGKTTTAMVLAEVGTDTNQNYHQQADWGMDILKVGKSLGAGSWAVQLKANGKDTLVRLGGASMGPITYQLLANGPLRSVIRIKYPEWQLPQQAQTTSFTETISAIGGQYGYSSRVDVQSLPANAQLVTGIVSLHANDTFTIRNQVLASYGRQSENNDNLGMGWLYPSTVFDRVGEAGKKGDVQDTHLLFFKPQLHTVSAIFIAAWEKSSPAFANKAGFERFISREALKARHPITIF